jgi:hypothetical protein
MRVRNLALRRALAGAPRYYSRARVRRWSFPSACSFAPDSVTLTSILPSLDEKKAQTVVDEIKGAGGEALAVGGDVGADDFPEKVLGATIKCVKGSNTCRSMTHVVSSSGSTASSTTS